MWGGLGAAGATVGLITGGLLTGHAGWDCIFFLNVPIGSRPWHSRRSWSPGGAYQARRRYDPLGAVTATGGQMLLVHAMSTAPQDGWSSPKTIGTLATAGVLRVAFVVVERRAGAPLLPLRMLRNRAVASANLAGLLLGGSFFAFIFIGTFSMQQALGHPALQTGLTWLATSLSSVALAGLAQVLVTRIGAGPVMAAGMATIVGGTRWATQVPVRGTFWADLAGGLIVAGAGTAFAFISISVARLIGVGEATLASPRTWTTRPRSRRRGDIERGDQPRRQRR